MHHVLAAADPITLGPGRHLGGLGLEQHTRRRNRLNGTVQSWDAAAGSLDLAVDQSFGNCPRYITVRLVVALGAQGSELRVLILDSLRCRGEEDLLRRSVDIIQNFETIIRLHPAFGWRQAELIMASAQARTIMLDEAALRNVGKPRPVQRGAALGPQQRAFAASASTFFIATCAAAF